MTDQDAGRHDGQSASAEILDHASGTQALNALQLRLALLVAPRLVKRPIRGVLQAIEQGTPLEEAIAKHRNSIPQGFVGLFEEALHTADPAAVILAALEAHREVRESWREFKSLIAYPVCLFVLATSIAVGFSFILQSMQNLNWIEDFGLSGTQLIENNIIDQHHAITGLGMLTAWVALVLVTIACVGPAWAWVSVVGGLFLVGRPLRWIHLRELLNRLELFVGQGLDTATASQATSRSFAGSGQSKVAHFLCYRVEQGMPLGQSLAESTLADRLCRPALLMLDIRGHDLPEGLRRTAELLAYLTEQRCRSLATILPVFVMLIVGTILWSTISAYFFTLVPLFTLITALS